MLSNRALTPDKIDAQLDELFIRFMSDRSRNRYNTQTKTVELSRIFDWYGKDFDKGHKGFSSVNDVVAKYARPTCRYCRRSRATSLRQGADPLSGVRLVAERRALMRLAVVVPVFNEATAIESTLARLSPLRTRGVRVIVVDGGSTDATATLAKPHADQVLQSDRGRAQQMNAGAKAAIDGGADVLLFVHADSELPDSADRLIDAALRTSGRAWGRFDVRIDGRRRC